jgi:DnaJ like chaperone protein
MSSFFFRNIYFKIAKSLIILAAKLSKVDGQVSKVELTAIKDVLKIPDNEIDQVGKIFNEAKKKSDDYELHAEHISKIYQNNPKILREVIHILFYIAEADGNISQSELKMIEVVAKIFGFSPAQFKSIENEREYSDKLNPYIVLGVKPKDDLTFIRNKYIELSKENHPDLLQGRGASIAEIETNKKKMNSIISAWKNIQKLKA